MTIFVNKTPHIVTFQKLNPRNNRAETVSIQPTLPSCRVATESFQRETLDGVPVQTQTYGEVLNLPEPQPGTVYIVSGIVLLALRIKGIRRDDVIAPATGNRDGALRNAEGRVAAVTRFHCLPHSRIMNGGTDETHAA